MGKSREMGKIAVLAQAMAWALAVWGAWEAGVGLAQLLGYGHSNHALYAMTGSFLNPGPFSGFIAMAMPVALWLYLKATNCIARYVAALLFVLMFCVLPAGWSRSAWIAAAVACLWVYGCHKRWGVWLKWCYTHRRKRLAKWVAATAAALLLLAVGLFLLKPDSARGRLFMWRMEWRAIAEKPWTGHGDGAFAAAYGRAQEAYFAQGDYAAWEERVAGTPEYAFNEYLQGAIEYGVPTVLIAICLTLLAAWRGYRLKRYGIAGGLLALAIFAFSSYPFRHWEFVAVYLMLLWACIVPRGWKGVWLSLLPVVAGVLCFRAARIAERERQEGYEEARFYYERGAYEAAIEDYMYAYQFYREDGKFLFELGHALHKKERYEESNRYLMEAEEHSCDPMILNIMGKNYQALGQYKEAEHYYRRSINRLPGRIYPYYLLALLYSEPDYYHPQQLEEACRMVLEKEPKVHSTAIEEMRDIVNNILNNGINY